MADTDFEWFTFLRQRQPLEEVNFWQPSGGDAFRALEPGEPSSSTGLARWAAL